MKKVLFEGKKRFHLLKSLLYKNEKAQNMPEVAGCLGPYTVEPHCAESLQRVLFCFVRFVMG